MENTVPIGFRNAAAGIGNADLQTGLLPGYRHAHRPAGAVILDGVFRQIEQHPVEQGGAAGHGGVALPLQGDPTLFRQRRKVGENLLDHRPELDAVRARRRLQAVHLQQRLGQLGQPLGLLPQQAEEFRGFGQHLRMLGGKQLELRLHQRQRRAQLMGCVAGELPLGFKRAAQPLQHLVERPAQLPELRQQVLIDLDIRQIGQLHLSVYTDAAQISAYAQDAMQWAAAVGLVNGRTATTLVPQGSATRAEGAKILTGFTALS